MYPLSLKFSSKSFLTAENGWSLSRKLDAHGTENGQNPYFYYECIPNLYSDVRFVFSVFDNANSHFSNIRKLLFREFQIFAKFSDFANPVNTKLFRRFFKFQVSRIPKKFSDTLKPNPTSDFSFGMNFREYALCRRNFPCAARSGARRCVVCAGSTRRDAFLLQFKLHFESF